MTGLIPHNGVITKEGMIPLLVESCPEFSSKWNDLQAEWKDDKDGLPYYVCLGEFARNLVENQKQDDTEKFPAIFQAVERLYVEGDVYVREAAAIGLLEAIQNISGQSAVKFVPYLGPETKRLWVELNEFWEAGSL